jgi:hypothetical protein
MLRVIAVVCSGLTASCGQSAALIKPAAQARLVNDLVLLTREGCLNTDRMRKNLDQALLAMGLPPQYVLVDLTDAGPGDPRAGFGTPTVLHRGRDVFGMPAPTGNAEAT